MDTIPVFRGGFFTVTPTEIVQPHTDIELFSTHYLMDFTVKIVNKKAIKLYDDDDRDDYYMVYDDDQTLQTSSVHRKNNVKLPVPLVMTDVDHSATSALARKVLPRLRVPPSLCEALADKLVNKAADVAWRKQLMGFERVYLRMAVEIEIYVVYETSVEDFFGTEIQFVGASKSSIEKLEKVRMEEEMVTRLSLSCSICLEEIVVGSEATRMPCSHLYHEDCIVEWLEQSRFCPLCRFAMPTRDDHDKSQQDELMINEDMPNNCLIHGL